VVVVVSTSEEWIVVPNWSRFQHYRDRNPPWIRVYTELSSDADWTSLPLGTRGLLTSLWIEYARADGVLATSRLRKLVQDANFSRRMKALKDAGFVAFSASRPLAIRYQNASPRVRLTEAEAETETPQTPLTRGARKLTREERQRYTGARYVYNGRAAAYVRDPLGTDKPPTSWPHPPPAEKEILAALEARNGVPDSVPDPFGEELEPVTVPVDEEDIPF
jgi:hypothetical protein